MENAYADFAGTDVGLRKRVAKQLIGTLCNKMYFGMSGLQAGFRTRPLAIRCKCALHGIRPAVRPRQIHFFFQIRAARLARPVRVGTLADFPKNLDNFTFSSKILQNPSESRHINLQRTLETSREISNRDISVIT